MSRLFRFLAASGILLCSITSADEPVVDYTKDVAPVLRKYCAGCHNDADKSGEFSAESYASLQAGIEEKPAILPGDASGSPLWRVLSGQGDSQMPPEGEPAPSEQERQLLKLWIDQGAIGPEGSEPDRLTMQVPKIQSQTSLAPVTALAISPDGTLLALGRYEEVLLLPVPSDLSQVTSLKDVKPRRILSGLPGKVQSIHFLKDGHRLVTASGVSGSGGIATLWDVASGKRLRDFQGHRDIIFDAEISPDQTLLATCSYDRQIHIWELETGKLLRTLTGHNGAVFDVAFHPDGKLLASASADDTCKIWRVSDGERMDTLGQPLKEQYTIEFTHDGKFVVAAGADNRIRVWKIISHEKPRINPLVDARFAHEAPIVRLQFTPTGDRLVSVAEDTTLKVWETKRYTEIQLSDQPAVVVALAMLPDGKQCAVGRLDGSYDIVPLPESQKATESDARQLITGSVPKTSEPMHTVQEHEANDTAGQAEAVALPVRIEGAIAAAKGKSADQDCFRFHAKRGEEWVIEVNAARSKSPLDSYVDILTPDGKPVERVLLQAVRDSYFTFRGKNGDQANDFRLFNWEEMQVNQLLYCNGEVVKLWQLPRGPDSGFNVYPGSGLRWGYFGTTGLSHALGEPCYVVEAYPPGTQLIPNGLPQFQVFYENDDSARRDLGKDSKLFFTAPADGDYVVRIRDVRDESGPKYTYAMSVRPPQRGFAVTLADRKPKVAQGSATELLFRVQRQDEFDGPITIDIQNLPPGLSASTPILIQSEQIDASGVLIASEDAAPVTKEQLKSVQITATATVDGQQVEHAVAAFEEISVSDKAQYRLAIVPAEDGVQPIDSNGQGPLEFAIRPGETIMLKVVADRRDFKDQISFGKEDSGRNLPHGVYVDNIGLNGLLLLEDQSERKFFITAADWVPEQTRMFHLQGAGKNAPATHPVILHVTHDDSLAAKP